MNMAPPLCSPVADTHGATPSRDPFKIDGPACISFSGGRTSGYMLWKILEAHGGTLPDDVLVCFANTGRETPETLEFIWECEERWGVHVNWLEYRPTHGFEIVNINSASRDGEPFSALINHRGMVPNPVGRFCTVELKVRTMHRFLRSLGWTEWTSVLGIRADEPRRVAKLANQDYGKHEEKYAPLAVAGIGVETVGQFWKGQPFDLKHPSENGRSRHTNCDLCFLKPADQILSLIREEPKRAIWWMAQESIAKAAGAGGRKKEEGKGCPR